MTIDKFWWKCKEFDWSSMCSLDIDEWLDAKDGYTNLRAIAAQHSPEFEEMLNRFRKAHEFAHLGCTEPPQPHIGGTDETSGKA